MRKILLHCAFIIVALLTASCGITKEMKYSDMYSQQPTSIMIMPPINQTSFVDAKLIYFSSLYRPLCERGYYVFSPYMTMEMLQNESAYDAEPFLNGDLKIFNQVLGADAALFTVIKNWKKATVGSSINVDVEYILRSTTTGQTLYHREGELKLDLSVKTGFGGIGGFIADATLSKLNQGLTDKIEAGRLCNFFTLNDMPVGKYHNEFGKDKNVKLDKKSTVKTKVAPMKFYQPEKWLKNSKRIDAEVEKLKSAN